MVKVEAIQAAVAAEFGISLGDLLSASKKRQNARPRQVAMHLAYALRPGLGYVAVAHRFGRDHSTAVHADKLIPALMARDPVLAARVNKIRESFNGG